MCSTPRPKRKVKIASAAMASGSILSGLDAQKRAQFVQRANNADERRQKLAMQNKQKSQQQAAHSKKLTLVHSPQTPSNLKTKGWSYWLLDASFKEIFMHFFLGKSY